MSYGVIKEVRDTLDELMRMHQLNLELFETLYVVLRRVLKYVEENDIPLDDATKSLLNRVAIIYDEIVSPPFLQHRFRTPEDATEPL